MVGISFAQTLSRKLLTLNFSSPDFISTNFLSPNFWSVNFWCVNFLSAAAYGKRGGKKMRRRTIPTASGLSVSRLYDRHYCWLRHSESGRLNIRAFEMAGGEAGWHEGIQDSMMRDAIIIIVIIGSKRMRCQWDTWYGVQIRCYSTAVVSAQPSFIVHLRSYQVSIINLSSIQLSII